VPVNHVDRFGFTPLEGAVRGKHKELVLLLKEAGGRVMHNGFLCELEASALSGVVPLQADLTAEMDWEIPTEQIPLTGILGEGAFGTVHKGAWRGTMVAVKTLKRLQNANADKVALAEFRTELAMIQHLHHPHVVQFLGVMSNPTDGAPLLVTEYMEHGSLADWFRKPTGLGAGQCLELCLDCCRGMTYLHGRSPNPVLHRDLKPNNLMLTAGMRLKIGDFGLSKTLSVRNRLPQDMSQAYKLTGETGSYRYMAPEVFRHEYYGPPVDVYAFSMVAYQMYHHQVPFEGMSPVDAARAAAFERRRPVLASHLPKELADVIRDCWQPNPNSRPTFEDAITRLMPLHAKFAASGAEGGCCALQ
jgi:serine/threonine protein kinase